MRSVVGQRRVGLGVPGVRALGAFVVPAVLAATSAVLVWAASAPIDVVRAPGPAPVDALFALGAALVCAVVLALAAVGATLTLILAVTGHVAGALGTAADVLTPRFVRAALCLAMGATVAASPVGPVAADTVAADTVATSPRPTASASPPSSRPAHSAHQARLTLPSGWSPDRPAAPADQSGPTDRSGPAPPSGAAHQSGAANRSGPAVRPQAVLVRAGDTLWAITARNLGPGATNAQVVSAWPRWYATNRSTIGADPDLILPGQRLAVPKDQRTTNREELR